MQRSKDLVIRSNLHCSPRRTSKHYAKPLVKLVKRLTKLKSQEQFLTQCGELDIFSSIRPKVGKTFKEADMTLELNKIIEEARRKIVDVGRKEKSTEISKTKEKLNLLYKDMQELPLSDFRNLHAKAKKAEERLQCTISKNQERKVKVFHMKHKHPPEDQISAPTLIKEKRRRHQKTWRVKKREYKKKRRSVQQDKRRLETQIEVQKIKESNLVKNFSNEDIPDEAYLYLALEVNFAQLQHQKCMTILSMQKLSAES